MNQTSGAGSSEVIQAMLEKDRFSRWLGLQIQEHGKGYCKLSFQITELMLNGFDIVHGGVLFAASDSAFAFASNSQGRLAVALDVTVSFVKTVRLGEILWVEAKEVHLGEKIGLYEVRTSNSQGELVALFKGTAYRTSQTMERPL